jgi:FkbM family methyltransferase
MLRFFRNTRIEKIIKSKLFFLYISNYIIRHFRFLFLPYEKDWNVFKHLKISDSDIILDIGAHWGESFLSFRKYYNNQIYCYEPDKDSFNFLKKISKNKNVKCFNYGINKYKNKTRLYYPTFNNNRLTLWGSENLDLLKKKIDKFTYLDSKKIKYKSIFCTFKSISLKKTIGIIKIDVEGSEFKVLKSINLKSIKKSKVIFLEYNLESFLHCYNFIKKIGFESFIYQDDIIKKKNFKQISKITKKNKFITNIIFINRYFYKKFFILKK